MNYVIANWKSNITTAQDAQLLATHIVSLATHESVAWCICPATEHIAQVASVLAGSRVLLGAQDIDMEVGVDQLTSLGVSYVIVGHSDRRWKLGESEEVVARKLRAVLASGMTPVLCVGERTSDEDRDAVVDAQLASAVGDLSQQERSACLVAYEPVWAISTSDNARPDTPERASAVARHIQEVWGPKAVLYGGSVSPETMGGFWSAPAIEGVLVGKASTIPASLERFLGIISTSSPHANN